MIRCIAFDFERKHDEPVAIEAVRMEIASGRFVWVDVELGRYAGRTDIERAVGEHLHLSPDVIEIMSRHKADTGYEHVPDGLHIAVVSCKWADHRLATTRVDVLMSAGFLLTMTRGHAEFLDNVRRDYRDDFERFARSPGFLLYEMFDHLTRSYEMIEQHFEEEVERMHLKLAGRLDASVFPLASRVAANIVRLRRHVAPARAVAAELGSRRSPMVPETTQPFLLSTAAELERILTDLTVSREILTDAVHLSMSYLTYRTNNVINALTTVSFIFLPLTFLVGVYGMNFEFQPEYKWRFGYLWFWGLVAAVSGAVGLSLWLVMRREKRAIAAARRPGRTVGARAADSVDRD